MRPLQYSLFVIIMGFGESIRYVYWNSDKIERRQYAVIP